VLRGSGGAVKKQHRGAGSGAALIHRQVSVVAGDLRGRPGGRHRLAELNEHAVRLLWVDEHDSLVVGPCLRRLTQQFESGVLQAPHGFRQIVDLERKVMEAFALPLEKPVNGRVLLQTFEEFQFGRRGVDKVGTDLLGTHGFGLVGLYV